MNPTLLVFIIVATAVTAHGYRILQEIKRKPVYFTQGLFFDSDTTLVESTGLYGESRIQRLDASTGEPTRTHKLDGSYFGEGCAMVDGRIYQLTWREGVCFVYDRDFRLLETRRVPSQVREGWGATTDGKFLYVSDGSQMIHVIDPESWTVSRQIEVHYEDGRKIYSINALQYVNGYIYANVYHTNSIVKVDSRDGTVSRIYDLRKLAERNEEGYGAGTHHDQGNDVLNGIAYYPPRGTFYVTGKRWNFIFELRLK